MKYSQNFLRDVRWYLHVRHHYTCAGKLIQIQYDPKGVDFLKAFHVLDSQGKTLATRHPKTLKVILTAKASINMFIQMYAEDRAKGYFTRPEFDELCKELNAPEWFINAVENQKIKYFKTKTK